MDVAVKDKKKKRKPDSFSMLINLKGRMMYALFSNAYIIVIITHHHWGLISKHWIIRQSKVLLICEDGCQMWLWTKPTVHIHGCLALCLGQGRPLHSQHKSVTAFHLPYWAVVTAIGGASLAPPSLYLLHMCSHKGWRDGHSLMGWCFQPGWSPPLARFHTWIKSPLREGSTAMVRPYLEALGFYKV